MDPSAPPNDKKDSNWNFPPDIEFPAVARVIMKFYKVVGTDDDDGKTVQTVIALQKMMVTVRRTVNWKRNWLDSTTSTREC